MKKKQVYLFACIEKNIGDDLFIYIISKRYPNVEFIISHDADYLKINNLNNLNYSIKLKIWLMLANNSSSSFIKRLLASIMERIYRLMLKKLDSIYIVGNAFKNINYKGKYQINWLNRRINISNDFYLISTNYGPSNNDNWKEDCREVFAKITDVCFRDINSYKLFDDLSNVRYAPDTVFSLNRDLYNNKNKKKYIIISVIDCSMKDRNKELKESADIYEEKMSLLINDFNKRGIDVVLLNSNTKQDYPASKRIYDRCILKDNVSIYNYDGNLNNIFSLFNNAKAVIATRLHTIILGLIYDIPILPIIYDIKVENILKSYKFNGVVENIYDLQGLNASSVQHTIENYSFKISNQILLDAHKQFAKIDKKLK